MSNRPITEDDLHAYVDGVLEPEREAEVAAYLEGHPDMARRVAAFSDQRDLLRKALAPIADEPRAVAAQSVSGSSRAGGDGPRRSGGRSQRC